MAEGARMWLQEPRYGFQRAGLAPGAMFFFKILFGWKEGFRASLRDRKTAPGTLLLFFDVFSSSLFLQLKVFYT